MKGGLQLQTLACRVRELLGLPDDPETAWQEGRGPKPARSRLAQRILKEQAAARQRASIAWCGECGNVSVDGINFSSIDGKPGWLICLACGEEGPFEYRQVGASAPSPDGALRDALEAINRLDPALIPAIAIQRAKRIADAALSAAPPAETSTEKRIQELLRPHIAAPSDDPVVLVEVLLAAWLEMHAAPPAENDENGDHVDSNGDGDGDAGPVRRGAERRAVLPGLDGEPATVSGGEGGLGGPAGVVPAEGDEKRTLAEAVESGPALRESMRTMWAEGDEDAVEPETWKRLLGWLDAIANGEPCFRNVTSLKGDAARWREFLSDALSAASGSVEEKPGCEGSRQVVRTWDGGGSIDPCPGCPDCSSSEVEEWVLEGRPLHHGSTFVVSGPAIPPGERRTVRSVG